MRLTVLGSITALALTLPVSMPALAQPAQQQPTAKKPLDPNEVVCEKEEVVGSRLATNRVCKTRAQWAEERRADRDEIEKVQRQRGMNTPQ